jgi:hypothetical protein
MIVRYSLFLMSLLMASLAVAQTTAPTFEDPVERAFTVEVPRGWTVKGGLVRMGYSDARPIVDLKSPDGRTNIRLGDVTIPAYFVPNQIHSNEGEIYDLGAQAQLTVAKYRTGQEFAARYGQARFKSVCRGLTPQQWDGPVLPAYLPEDVSARQSSTGQAVFLCDTGQGPETAYVFARTSLYDGFWLVPVLGSLVAPQNQVAAARDILLRCAQSFKLSPAWREYQKKMDQEALEYQRASQQARRREISREVAQAEMKMQGMKDQVNSFERGQARQAAQVESFGNILTGITPTIDPYGNPRNVWTGPKSGYWTNGLGQVVNSNTSPGPGWQQLMPTQ